MCVCNLIRIYVLDGKKEADSHQSSMNDNNSRELVLSSYFSTETIKNKIKNSSCRICLCVVGSGGWGRVSEEGKV